MASTPGPLSLPYPVLGDAPDGPGAFAALANRIQAILGQDTGWVAASLSTNWTGQFYYRRCAATVTVYGAMTKATTSTNQTVSITNSALPANIRPSATLDFPGILSNSDAARINLTAAGVIDAINVTATGPYYLYFVVTYVTSFPSS